MGGRRALGYTKLFLEYLLRWQRKMGMGWWHATSWGDESQFDGVMIYEKRGEKEKRMSGIVSGSFLPFLFWPVSSVRKDVLIIWFKLDWFELNPYIRKYVLVAPFSCIFGMLGMFINMTWRLSAPVLDIVPEIVTKCHRRHENHQDCRNDHFGSRNFS